MILIESCNFSEESQNLWSLLYLIGRQCMGRYPQPTLQTFMILPKEKTTVWVKKNGHFFQQNYSVIKIQQNWAYSAKSSQVARMNKNCFCSVGEKNIFLLSMLSIAYFSLWANFCKIGYTFFPTQVLFFFLCGVENVCSDCFGELNPG